jgi:HAD superfamily hydrolase (TIGR01484 family)
MTVKLVLTDLDGTVVHPGMHEVSPKVIEAVKAAEAAGVVVSAVTGRYFELSKEVLKVLGFKDLCVFSGGACIANPVTEEIVWSKLLPVEQVRSILRKLVPFSTIISLAAEGRDYFITPGEFDIDGVAEPAAHVWASVPRDKVAALVAATNQDPQLMAHDNVKPGGDDTRAGIQITLRDADKYHGVGQLLKITGVDKKHVLAIGDGNNDLPLFRQAGFKVAMGNATDGLKAAADAVVGTVDEDGFAQAINQFVLKQNTS